MAYAASTTVLILIPGITTTNDSAAADALNEQLRRADNIINAKLSRRYVVPFTSAAIPPIVRNIAEDLTACMLFRSMFSRDGQNRNNHLDEQKVIAMKMLDDIAGGKIDLINTAGTVIGETNTDTLLDSSSENYFPIFDVGSASSQAIDADRLKDIADRKV